MAKTLNNAPLQRQPKSKKLIIIAVAVFVFLALGGGSYWYASGHGLPFLGHSKTVGAKVPEKDASPAAILQLKSFVVNLADPNQAAFLRVGIALGLSKPLQGASHSEKDSPYTPQVRDAILSVLSTWKSGDLLAKDGKKDLKKQLLATLQQRVPELGVVEVYFTDFLIQQ